MTNKEKYWVVCPDCEGSSKSTGKIRKHVKRRHQEVFDKSEKTNSEENPSAPARIHLYTCTSCRGSGLINSATPPLVDKENFPHVAIIGAGIGGVALAVACLHRGIPFTLYERDNGFDVRSQGYGLTLQQASKAIEGLGIFSLPDGITSTRHLVHTTDGKVIAEWGHRKWMNAVEQKSTKRHNVNIARQSLRLAMLEQLGGDNAVHWGHELIDFDAREGAAVELRFLVNGKLQNTKADLVVGADGIHSAVRRLLIGDELTPLRYLGCIVILGICPLANLNGFENPLLDSATVFQTANKNTRLYIMPYTSDSVMWQLSFPMEEIEAKALSAQGVRALKDEARRRAQWHDPVSQILEATEITQVTGYPVYDRALLEPELLENAGAFTLIGDAAHPMSPFKAQGANQALLDALALARLLYKECRPSSQWKDAGLRKSVLTAFESEMLERSASKVKVSSDAAKFHENGKLPGKPGQKNDL